MTARRSRTLSRRPGGAGGGGQGRLTIRLGHRRRVPHRLAHPRIDRRRRAGRALHRGDGRDHRLELLADANLRRCGRGARGEFQPACGGGRVQGRKEPAAGWIGAALTVIVARARGQVLHHLLHRVRAEGVARALGRREAHAGALAAPRGVVGTRAALAEPAAAAARTIGLAFELRRIGGERGWGGALGAARAACRAHLIRRGAHRGEQDHRHRPTVAMRAWLPAAVYPAIPCLRALRSMRDMQSRHTNSSESFCASCATRRS